MKPASGGVPAVLIAPPLHHGTHSIPPFLLLTLHTLPLPTPSPAITLSLSHVHPPPLFHGLLHSITFPPRQTLSFFIHSLLRHCSPSSCPPSPSFLSTTSKPSFSSFHHFHSSFPSSSTLPLSPSISIPISCLPSPSPPKSLPFPCQPLCLYASVSSPTTPRNVQGQLAPRPAPAGKQATPLSVSRLGQADSRMRKRV